MAIECQRDELIMPSTSTDTPIRKGRQRQLKIRFCKSILSSDSRRVSYCEDYIAHNLNSRFRSSNLLFDSILLRNTPACLIQIGGPPSLHQPIGSSYCSSIFHSAKFNTRRARRRDRSKNWYSICTKLLALTQFVGLLFLLSMLRATFAFATPPALRNVTSDASADQRHYQYEGSSIGSSLISSRDRSTITLTQPVRQESITITSHAPATIKSRPTSAANSPSVTPKQQFYNTIGAPVYSRPNPSILFYRENYSNAYTIKISKKSWETYEKFKKDTCRNRPEVPIDGKLLNNTDSGYFTWEESAFHQELRKIILPRTQNNLPVSLYGTPYLTMLDARIFMSPPKSMCGSKTLQEKKKFLKEIIQTEKKSLEHQSFEDFLLNRIFSLPPHYPL